MQKQIRQNKNFAFNRDEKEVWSLVNKARKLNKSMKNNNRENRSGRKNKQQQHTPAFLFQLSISLRVTHLDAAVWEGVTRRIRLLEGREGGIRLGRLKISYHWRDERTGMKGLPSRSVLCGFSALLYWYCTGTKDKLKQCLLSRKSARKTQMRLSELWNSSRYDSQVTKRFLIKSR